MSKELRCKVCGEVEERENLLICEDGGLMCTTCDTVDRFEEIEEEEEMVNCICKYCGEEFESEEECEVCEECQEALDTVTDSDFVIAIAEHFGCAPKDVEEHQGNEWTIDGTEYTILVEEEADEAVRDYIEDSIWAFTPSFLADCTELPQELFEAVMDNDKCESNNDCLLAVVEKTCGLDELVQEAIRWDGRGHFLNRYDGSEEEFKYNGDYYFAYRY